MFLFLFNVQISTSEVFTVHKINESTSIPKLSEKPNVEVKLNQINPFVSLGNIFDEISKSIEERKKHEPIHLNVPHKQIAFRTSFPFMFKSKPPMQIFPSQNTRPSIFNLNDSFGEGLITHIRHTPDSDIIEKSGPGFKIVEIKRRAPISFGSIFPKKDNNINDEFNPFEISHFTNFENHNYNDSLINKPPHIKILKPLNNIDKFMEGFFDGLLGLDNQHNSPFDKKMEDKFDKFFDKMPLKPLIKPKIKHKSTQKNNIQSQSKLNDSIVSDNKAKLLNVNLDEHKLQEDIAHNKESEFKPDSKDLSDKNKIDQQKEEKIIQIPSNNINNNDLNNNLPKNEIEKKVNEEKSKEAVKLVTKYNEQNNEIKNYLLNNSIFDTKPSSKKKLLSTILKYLTWVVLLVLIGLILYVVFTSICESRSKDKTSYGVNEIEDELKSINRNKNKYY